MSKIVMDGVTPTIVSAFVIDDLLLRTKSDGEFHSPIELKSCNKKTKVMLGSKEYTVKDIEILYANEVSKEFLESETVYAKSFETELPTDLKKYPSIVRAVLEHLRDKKPLPVSKTQHSNKIAIIRSIKKFEEKETKLPALINQLDELLGYYGSSLDDMMRNPNANNKEVKDKEK